MLALLLALGVICSAYDAAAEPATSDGGGGLEYLTNMGAFTPPGGFQAVEDRKEDLQIEQYSVSQFSLEQIFIALAKTQEEEKGPIAGISMDS